MPHLADQSASATTSKNYIFLIYLAESVSLWNLLFAYSDMKKVVHAKYGISLSGCDIPLVYCSE